MLAVETFDGPLDAAFPPDSVSVQLEHDLDVGRGEILCGPEDLPTAGRYLEATVCWMSESPLRAGEHLALKHTTRTVRAAVESIDALFDVTKQKDETPPDQLELNDIARLTLRTSAPVVADPYGENRTTGAFILIDEDSNDTVGAGMVRTVRETSPRDQPHSPGVTWHESSLRRGQRWSALRTSGATVWLTGLPSSGKSTIAAALERSLVESGRAAYFLDGDNLRHGLSGDLAFSPADRTENIRRVAHVARLMADAGMVSIASLVSPAHHDRALARELHQAAGLRFVEVYVDTPVGDLRGARPEGPVRAGAGGQARGLHRRQRALRGAAQPRRADPRRRGGRQGGGRRGSARRSSRPGPGRRRRPTVVAPPVVRTAVDREDDIHVV